MYFTNSLNEVQTEKKKYFKLTAFKSKVHECKNIKTLFNCGKSQLYLPEFPFVQKLV